MAKTRKLTIQLIFDESGNEVVGTISSCGTTVDTSEEILRMTLYELIDCDLETLESDLDDLDTSEVFPDDLLTVEVGDTIEPIEIERPTKLWISDPEDDEQVLEVLHE